MLLTPKGSTREVVGQVTITNGQSVQLKLVLPICSTLEMRASSLTSMSLPTCMRGEKMDALLIIESDLKVDGLVSYLVNTPHRDRGSLEHIAIAQQLSRIADSLDELLPIARRWEDDRRKGKV